MEEIGKHRIIHDLGGGWSCDCGESFETQKEAMRHGRMQTTPERKLLDCIARQSHHSQPIEIVYEMRGQQTASGAVIPSPVNGSKWMATNQGNAERSRVTLFGCPNCGHQEAVRYE